jgi:hypothetical protein
MLMERHTSVANAGGSGASVSTTASTTGASFVASTSFDSTSFDSTGAAVSGISIEASTGCFCSGTGSVGVASFSAGVVITGVTGAADCRSFSRFFSSVRKKALSVVRSALFGLHRSGESGVCAHTEQVSGRDVWPRVAQKNHVSWNFEAKKHCLGLATHRTRRLTGHSKEGERHSPPTCCRWRIAA